jgi:hypothetical protein
MKTISFLKRSTILIEISQSWLRAFHDGQRVELAIEREDDGRLRESSRETLVSGLKAFVKKSPLQSRPSALCAISAMGVSLRRLNLPASASKEFQKMLRLQIESEFPLSPDELAWAYRELESGSGATRQFLVAAVKKEVVEDYAEVLIQAGLQPQFTIAALARNFVVPQPAGSHALLDVGGERPEWCVFEKGVPTVLRVLPATKEVSVLDSIEKVATGWAGQKIYLTGATKSLTPQMDFRAGGRVEAVTIGDERAGSAAISGLQKAIEGDFGAQLLLLETQVKPSSGLDNVWKGELKPWLARAAALICLLLFLPYAEALVMKPFLARKLSALQADKGRLAIIDHELDFLQSLKQTQPPYLDALFVLSKSAPQGTRFDSLSMDQHGDITMHGMMQNGQQVTDFRGKLISSGFFSAVSVEEQTPNPDRQHVTVRMSAHWKPFESRAGLAIGPTAEEIQQAKTNHDAAMPGMFPGGMMMPQ